MQAGDVDVEAKTVVENALEDIDVKDTAENVDVEHGAEDVNDHAPASLHCVRCHVWFLFDQESGCKIRVGRETFIMGIPRNRIVEICGQFNKQHVAEDKPFCFEGNHTVDSARSNWGVSDESDPLDNPAPEADVCEVCDEKIWQLARLSPKLFLGG